MLLVGKASKLLTVLIGGWKDEIYIILYVSGVLTKEVVRYILNLRERGLGLVILVKEIDILGEVEAALDITYYVAG